ncbi:hypothetical protein N7467_004839 [Penicillium canescens]|nr:hypothetical protein N7467_004839 [Penicillium canescens]
MADRIPRDCSQWISLAQSLNVSTTHLADLHPFHSASKLAETQFILMRTLWPAKVLGSEFSLPLNDKAKSAASRFLRNFTAFQKYIACIGDSKADISNPNLGAFGFILDSQRQITSELDGSRPTHESSSVILRRSPRDHHFNPRSPSVMSSVTTRTQAMTDVTAAADQEAVYTSFTKDEQIVNDALLLFLRALTITIPNAQCKWSSARAPFDPVRFGTNTMTARNDGYLQGINVPVNFAFNSRRVHSNLDAAQAYPTTI